MLFNKNIHACCCRVVTLIFGLLATYSLGPAAELKISWVDNAVNEEGFQLERRIGNNGTYQQLPKVAPNTTTFTDINLADNTTYCYRILAFNSAGNSAFSDESCATTRVANVTLAVSRSGNGSGTVTSSPAGINCGTDCTEPYASGTVVTLSAIAQSGSVFVGWSGGADCSDGSVTLNTAVSCTATFTVAGGNTLTTSVVNETTSGGIAGGKVISNPAGIDCGTSCSQTYTSGQVVTLSPMPAANSKFAGWTGDADCSDGSVTMNGSKTCTAKFVLNAGLTTVTINVTKTGGGKISSSNGAIDCGATCSTMLAVGSSISLTAIADAGNVFSGWSGGCSGTGVCNITATGNVTVAANFAGGIVDKVGVYRSSTGEWFFDRNGSGTWDGCDVDGCTQLFNASGVVPIAGDWNGSGTTKLGVFDPESSQWFLDANGNGIWDECAIDICSESFGNSSDIPAVGRWSDGGADRIAIFRQSEMRWHLDTNGNKTLEDCKIDKCASLSVYQAGDVPVAGNWTGRGTTAVGLFRPSTGEWFLDKNGNNSWNGCAKDLCVANFGMSGDIPVTGDWTGTGISRIGVFRPSTGEWFLDRNGNGRWEGPELDTYLAGFGLEGDVPVIGKW